MSATATSVTEIRGTGWSHRNARLVIDRDRRGKATGYVFTSVGPPVQSFDASGARNGTKKGRVGQVSWDIHCGCSGKANPLPTNLARARPADLLRLAQ